MSDTLHFRVRSSSSDEIYDVVATFKPSLRIACSCVAGSMGATACKHRTAILLGDVSALVEINSDEIEHLGREAAASPLGAAMRDLDDLQREAERVKRAIKAKQKQIGRLMDGKAT